MSAGLFHCVIFPTMTQRKKHTIGMVIFVLIVGVLLQVAYDPISSARHHLRIASVRTELPEALAKWDALGITDYTFEIRGDARSICRPSAVIQVRGGEVVKVETKGNDDAARLLPPVSWSDPDWGEEVFLCSYFHFTMPQFFDLVEQTLQSYPASIMQAEFDDEHGFVSDFSFGIYVGYGLLRPGISNCCNEFQIRNFQVLTDP